MNFCRKNLENAGKMKLCDMVANKMHSIEVSSLELLRENFKNALEISGKTQGILFFKNVATLLWDALIILLGISGIILYGIQSFLSSRIDLKFRHLFSCDTIDTIALILNSVSGGIGRRK